MASKDPSNWYPARHTKEFPRRKVSATSTIHLVGVCKGGKGKAGSMGDFQQGAGRLGGHRPHHHLLHLLLLLHPVVTLAMVGGFGCMRVVMQTCSRHLLSQAFLSQKQLVAFFLDVTSQLLKPTYLGGYKRCKSRNAHYERNLVWYLSLCRVDKFCW